jgi:hypothetical protein
MNWITISYVLYALMAWGLVGWSVVAWLSRPEPGPEDSDNGGGIPPLDDLDGPGIDWGALMEELETREHGFDVELEEVR